MKRLFGRFLLLSKPLFSRLFLSNAERLEFYKKESQFVRPSGMVPEFNFWHRFIFSPFFRRAQILETDLKRLKSMKGPVVFVLKNRGQLEYRFFNDLFLKEKIRPIVYAKKSLTLHWLPLKLLYKYAVTQLNQFYLQSELSQSHESSLLNIVKSGQSALVNLQISRDYLFGLIKTSPLKVLEPVIEAQKELDQPVHIVTLQFLYDKHPDRREATYFDLLFGNRSQPGAVRKLILFLMNYRRRPQAKFGEPISVQEFLLQHKNTEAPGAEALYSKVEKNLAIEKARITGATLETKEATLRKILENESVSEALNVLSETQNKSLEAVQKDVSRYLKEIAADVNYSYVEFVHVTLRYVWNNIYDGVVVKQNQLDRVREKAGKHPVVLVPMHRSHIDYLLISDIFYAQNITFPYICAGINMNFWPVGRLVRKCAGFFIRRRFDGNKVYKESLYQYVKHLLKTGHCLEFFIEGTRSRTGKMLKPKMGFLSLVMRAFYEKACDDIYFVPISVMYDNIIEQKIYQKEASGAEKKKESAGELVKVRRIFKKKYGKVYIDFAEPLSLKEYLQKEGADQIRDERVQVKDFGYHLTYQMNKIALVTPMALVSLALLSLKKSTFGAVELKKRIVLLKSYLDFKEVNYSDLILFSEDYSYNEVIKKLVNDRVLQEIQSFEGSFYKLDETHRIQLDYYKNNVVHFFASLACFIRSYELLKTQPTILLSDLIREFDKIKSLFSEDFTFSARKDTKEHLLRVIQFCEDQGFVSFDQEEQSLVYQAHGEQMLQWQAYGSLLDNFLEGQSLILRYLKLHLTKPIDSKTLTTQILEKVKPLYLRGENSYPEAMNKFNMESALDTFVSLGLIKKETKGRVAVFSRLAEESAFSDWVNFYTKLCGQSYSSLISLQGLDAEKNENRESLDLH